jgi:hypothetical protein
MSNKLAWIMGGIVVVLLLALPLVLSGKRGVQQHTHGFPVRTRHYIDQPAPAQDKNAPIITKAQYDALRTGMTYDEVSDLIGALETEASSEYQPRTQYTEATATSWLIWKNPNGSFARLGFISGKLAEKQQEDLK